MWSDIYNIYNFNLYLFPKYTVCQHNLRLPYSYSMVFTWYNKVLLWYFFLCIYAMILHQVIAYHIHLRS